MKLYFKFVAMQLKCQMQYKASFFMMALGQFLVSFTAFLSIFFLFTRFHTVQDYSFSEILICFSVILTSFSLTECFVRGFDVFPGSFKAAIWIAFWCVPAEKFSRC